MGVISESVDRKGYRLRRIPLWVLGVGAALIVREHLEAYLTLANESDPPKTVPNRHNELAQNPFGAGK